MPTTAFSDLRVWQESMDLVVDVYRVTRTFPRDELFGLVSQMRRTAVSVPSNIAEGKGRSSRNDQVHFFLNSRGSLLELETQVLIAEKLGYLGTDVAPGIRARIQEAERLLNGLINAFRMTRAS
jgi:four helix bundle protein